MATLREIRRRISGIKSTQKITKAMKMVASARLRRAQEAIVSTRPYARKLGELLGHLVTHLDATAHPLFVPRTVERTALVIVTSDRGLCGAFNSNLIRTAGTMIRKSAEDGTALRLVTVGKKSSDFFRKTDYEVYKKYPGIFSRLDFGVARGIVEELVKGYLAKEFDKVTVVYNEFKSVVHQRIVVEQMLPIPPEEIPEPSPTEKSYLLDYIFEPSGPAIVDALVPRHLNYQMWRILLESNAAEQAARRTAMDNATSNASEMIDDLTLSYNKARQASITKELLEIVGGAEALKTSS